MEVWKILTILLEAEFTEDDGNPYRYNQTNKDKADCRGRYFVW